MDIQSSRANEFDVVSSWFTRPSHPGIVDIFGISGFGGVGKSYLLSKVIEVLNPTSQGYLPLRVDGSNKEVLFDFMSLFSQQMAPAITPCGKSKYDYFIRTRKVAKAHQKLLAEVKDDLSKQGAAQDVIDAIVAGIKFGRMLNNMLPPMKMFVNMDAIPEGAEDILEKLPALAKRLKFLPVIRDLLGFSYADRLKTQLYDLCADEYVYDLTSMLTGHKGINALKHLSHEKLKSIDRLLLIVDDFETVGQTLGDFIVQSLIPKLQKAPFHTTLIILGRDALSDMHLNFQHHSSSLIRDTLRLKPFEKEIAMELFREAGHAESDLEELWRESQGYPFLVSLLCDAKGGSVMYHQQFYERTTRWMSPKEKSWVLPLCYLEEVNQSTIKVMLPDQNSEAVMKWFEREASLRDPNAKYYTVNPIIKRSLKEYHLKTLGKIMAQEWELRAQEACI